MSDLIDKANAIARKAVEWDLSREGIHPDGHGGYRMPGAPAPTSGDPVQPIVDEVVARYSDVPGLFEPFTWCPQGGDFRGMSTGMLRTLQKLGSGQVGSDPVTHAPVAPNPRLDRLATVADDANHRHGEDASSFVRNHQSHVRTVAVSQFTAAAVLKGCLEAEDAMWGEVAANIEQIADLTLGALDRTGDIGRSGFVCRLTVAAAVVATVVVLPEGAALTAVSAADSASTVAARGTDLELSGESATAVLDHLRDAIAELKQQIVDTETRIARAARAMGHLVESAPVNQFYLSRPMLAAEPRGPGSDHT